MASRLLVYPSEDRSECENREQIGLSPMFKRAIICALVSIFATVIVIVLTFHFSRENFEQTGAIKKIIYVTEIREVDLKQKLSQEIREEVVQKLKDEVLRRGIGYMNGDMDACLARGLNKACTQDGDVKFVTSMELDRHAKLIEFLGDEINAEFEIEILLKFKRYCTRIKKTYQNFDEFTKYLYLFRKDVIDMERHNRDAGNGEKRGYETELREDFLYDSMENVGYGDLFEGGRRTFEFTPLPF
ncbi:hypothetical protein BEWA_027370 [Theileria equi strain WA]|uniref:Uncharacterized protein n=1 Tax=Theileria equi strain WA TaxID=1537102 RepID=L0AXC9_THEEQ|nr:hypothetical protein BEWA_027370 [Theileria equi strain WA]AFZ79888.1 hypothetical protein BEWA_027370 [Theileria equi strain WA]|eukprot:XP_004829554.1 hypothetical protein BEWA_027370 [Theileria equi strain WA]